MTHSSTSSKGQVLQVVELVKFEEVFEAKVAVTVVESEGPVAVV
jgi:hypothetical protein